ncbi:hypothetical protein CBR_g37907 [Chara braunii]|uniref:Reverse transcriptase domain-containing protein n=1 Tax=Chara braunii TaxID=69332 RepID=A0A388LP30_CHABU|nr:hypothetical protein CBR_g37907 [Chara braunii]|eukprot:GBG84031.1 hypothetical protein CBR_g37907 [Chara braunii]
MAREKKRLKKEEEKLKAVEEEEEDEPPLQGRRGQHSGSKDEEMEKRISEWVANLSLGEEEEVTMYIPKDEQEAAMRKWEAEADVLKRQAMVDETRMEWKLAMMREKKKRVDEASEAVKDQEEVQKLTLRLTPQVDLQQKVEIIAQSVERLPRMQEQQYEFSRSQDIAVRSMRMGFWDFARELVGAVRAEVNHRLEKTERFCVGAIKGVKVAAPKEEEARPRREPVKVKFPDSYSGKREENFDNWEANVNTYVHLQQVAPDQHVLIAIHALRDEAASFARSLVSATNWNNDAVACSSFTPLVDFMKLLGERFADVARSVKASDKLQTIHAHHTVNFHWRTLSFHDAFGAEVVCTIPLLHPSIRCQVVTAKSFRATCAYEQPEEIGLCFLQTVAAADSSPTDLSSDPRVVRLLDEFADIFESPTGVVPDWPISHEIIFAAGVVSPKGCIYRMSEEELEVLLAQLDDLLAKGWIRPSSSPYGAPVLFVRKKNKDLRLCIDYRKLNAQTVKNAGPLPRIDDLLERLGGARYFSKLDLKLGYHQISIRPNDRYKSAFKTRYGHFEWVVMPFGLTNALPTSQAAMTNEFRAMLDRFMLVYLDDILVYSRTLEDHLGHLRRVLEALSRVKYKANRDKCEFVRQELECLGHFVTPEGISPLSDKFQAIQEWWEPRNVSDVLSFLGLAGYYQRFIKGYSKIAAHLTKLQCEDRSFDFGEEARESFLVIKAALLRAEVLDQSLLEGLCLPRTDQGGNRSGTAGGATSTSSSLQQTMEDWALGLGVDRLLQALEDRFADKERAHKNADRIARLGQQRYSGSLQSLFAESEQLTSTPGLVMSADDLLANFCRAAPEKFSVALYSAGHKDWRSFRRAALDIEAKIHVQAPSSDRRKGAFPRGGRKGKAAFTHAGSASGSDSADVALLK